MIVLALLVAFQSALSPAEAAAYARVDQIGQHAVSAGWCPRIGWQVSENMGAELQDRAAAEAAAMGVERAKADEWAGEAVTRRLQFMQVEMDAALKSIGEGHEKRDLTALFDRAEQRCQAFADDAISVGLITSEGTDARAIARLEMLDSLLEDMGQASWQTPQMFAKAELLYAAGACKPVVPASRHDAITDSHLPRPEADDRESRYLAGQYIQGIRSSAELGLDLTQCNRVLRTRLDAVS